MVGATPPVDDRRPAGVPVIVVTPAAVGIDVSPTVAAIAVGLRDESLTPVVLSPVRTGRPDARGVADEHPASVLAGGLDVVEPVRLYAVGPPVPAARAEGQELPPAAVLAALLAQTARRPGVDLVLLADSVGLFTPIDEDGATLADVLDLAASLAVRVGTVVVCDAAVGGVHAAVAVTEALRRRTLDLLGTVLATRPAEHDVAGAYLAATLEGATGLPLLGSIPEGAGGWEPSVFADRAGAWLPIR